MTYSAELEALRQDVAALRQENRVLEDRLHDLETCQRRYLMIVPPRFDVRHVVAVAFAASVVGMYCWGVSADSRQKFNEKVLSDIGALTFGTGGLLVVYLSRSKK